MIACTSGWFWQSVPSRFQTKAMASSRSTSTPRLARNSTISAYSANTSGFAQLTSHCQELNVVHTQPSTSSSQVKLPGAKSGKTSGRVRFVGVGLGAVREDAEVVAVLRVSGAGGPRPGVLAGHVVEHQVDDQADPGSSQLGRRAAQVVHRAEIGSHRTVVGHRVAAVIVAVAGPQQRHQVQVA